MNHLSAVSFGIIFFVFTLVIGTASAATVFPAINPDFSFGNASVAADGSFSQFFSSTGSPVFGNIVWSAYNARQREGIAATGAGSVVVTGTNGSFAMQLTGFGHNGAVQPVFAGTSVANGTRLDIVRPGYTEWYVNRDAGIEQGMTISTRPQGNGTFQASYTLSGNLRQSFPGRPSSSSTGTAR